MPCHARPESHTLPALTLELSRHMIRAIFSHPLLESASRLRQAVQLSNSSHPCSPHTPRESAVEELPAHWTSNIPELKSKWIRLPLEYLFNILCTLATGYPTLKHTWRALSEGQENFDKHKNMMLYRYAATSMLVRLPPVQFIVRYANLRQDTGRDTPPLNGRIYDKHPSHDRILELPPRSAVYLLLLLLVRPPRGSSRRCNICMRNLLYQYTMDKESA